MLRCIRLSGFAVRVLRRFPRRSKRLGKSAESRDGIQTTSDRLRTHIPADASADRFVAVGAPDVLVPPTGRAPHSWIAHGHPARKRQETIPATFSRKTRSGSVKASHVCESISSSATTSPSRITGATISDFTWMLHDR